MPDQPETSPLAQIVVTPVVRELGAGLAPVAVKPLSSQGTFSPVIERVIHDLDDNNGSEALHLRSGKLSSIPAEASTNRATLDVWFKTNQMNLLADFARDRWALMVKDLKLTELGEKRWGELQAEEIRHRLQLDNSGLEMLERNGQRFYLLGQGARPPTLLGFQTGNGDIGVLEITAFTENPRGLKIRYKLAKLAAGVSAVSPTNTLQKRLIDLKLRHAVAVANRESLDPQRVQIEDELTRFEQNHPGLRPGDFRSLLVERRGELTSEKVRLARMYIASHPRIAEVEIQIEAMDTMLSDNVSRSATPRVSGGRAGD